MSDLEHPKFLARVQLLLLCGCVMFGLTSMGSTAEELSVLLEDTRIETGVPGLRAAIRFSDGEIVNAAVGLADMESGDVLNDISPMPGGSTGKTFVAALTLLLVEDGVLSLDDHAHKWLADEKWFEDLPNAREIRVRHLLSHSAGLLDYAGARGYMWRSFLRAIRKGSVYFNREELIRFTLKKKPLFAPGEGFAYSDIGYILLGLLIETATEREYFDLLRERILEPLELNEIVVQDRSVLPGITTGYTRGARNLRKDGSMKFDPSSEWTGGGLATNPTMLVKFLGALVDGKLVSSKSFEQMVNAGWRNTENPEEHYGLGLFVYEGGAKIGHAGLWPGYRTDMMHYSANGMTIAVQTNQDGDIDMRRLIGSIASLVEEGDK